MNTNISHYFTHNPKEIIWLKRPYAISNMLFIFRLRDTKIHVKTLQKTIANWHQWYDICYKHSEIGINFLTH